ncbi:MAG: hypothetical protein PHS59_10470 [Paludibacter sp.]|nr:hypothetical protein [Paludibacter sp.]
MRTKKSTTKKEYIAPEVIEIILDNEISLSLDSLPPYGPGESIGTAPEYLNKDPYKIENV